MSLLNLKFERELGLAVANICPVDLLERLLLSGQWEEYLATCEKLFELLRRKIGVTARAAHFGIHLERSRGYPGGYWIYSVGPPKRNGDSIQQEGNATIHPVTFSESEGLRRAAARHKKFMAEIAEMDAAQERNRGRKPTVKTT